MKILFATPVSGGMVHWKYHQACFSELMLAEERLPYQKHYDIAMYTQGGYSGLGKDRGIIASFALRQGFDKLLFVDSDQSWVWNDVKTLLDSPRPIVGGMVPLKFYPTQLNFTPILDDKHYFQAEGGVTTIAGIERWRRHNSGEDEMRVGAIGTGFLCIDVRVLEQMVVQKTVQPFDYYQFEYGEKKRTNCWDFFASGPINGQYYGEDYGFAIQAKRTGFDSYVNTAVRIPHWGNHEYVIGATYIQAPERGTMPPSAREHNESAQMPLPFPDETT